MSKFIQLEYVNEESMLEDGSSPTHLIWLNIDSIIFYSRHADKLYLSNGKELELSLESSNILMKYFRKVEEA